MYKVEFSEHADAEMLDISDYIYDESGSAEVAINVVVDLTDRIRSRLSRMPNSGLVELITDDGVVYRQIVVERYYVIYRIEENEDEAFVLVTNVIHDKRDKDNILTKLDKK